MAPHSSLDGSVGESLEDSRLDDTLLGISTRSVGDAEADTVEHVPGSRIGRYVVLEQVGRGGMGVVLAAFDPQLNRKIALKLLHPRRPDGSRSSGSASARLLREAQAIAKLSHPNVISVYDVGQIGEGIYVAMEFVEGQTLTAWLVQERRSVQDIVEIFLQAARGLAAAHAGLLVHRDFKPDNVLVGSDGQVRVSDFGLARLDPSQVGEERPPGDSQQQRRSLGVNESDVLASQLTQSGIVVGTPRYMAPEQHAGASADARSDQFAFCVALYQSLYHRDPFVANSIARLAQAKAEGDIQPIPSNVRVPSNVEDVVLRGLSADPVDRYPSMEALVVDLERDPTVWRHRLALGAAGAAVVALLAFGGEPDRNVADTSGCDAPWQDAWKGVWDDPRKRELASHGLPVGAAEVFDAWVTEWGDVRGQVCVGPSSGRGRTLAAPRLHLACLKRQRPLATGVLGAVADLPPADLAASGSAFEALPEPKLCARPEFVVGLPPAPPEDQAAQVVAIRTTIGRADAMRALGRDDVALELALGALSDATSTNYVPSRAEAQLAIGRAFAALGQPQDARRALREANRLATQSKHDALVESASRELVDTAVALGRYDEATLWEERSEAMQARLRVSGEAQADLARRSSLLALRLGNPGRAVSRSEEAVAYWEAEAHDARPGRRQALLARGEIMLATGRLPEARAAFHRALELARPLPGGVPERAAALGGLGSVALDEGRLDEARAQLDEAIDLLDARPSLQLARWMRQRAHVAEVSEAFDDAKAELVEALAIVEKVAGKEHPFYAIGLTSLGRVQRKLGDHDSSRESLADAQRRLALRSTQESLAYAAASFELAELDLGAGVVDDAVKGFEAAVAALDLADPVDGRVLAEAWFGRARALWAKNHDPTAKQAVERARAALADEGPRGEPLLAKMDLWLATTQSDG